MNITTWADSVEAAKEKISAYLSTFDWHLISVDRADQIDDSRDYGEPIAEMLERTRSNPDAIILGTFHTYKEN